MFSTLLGKLKGSTETEDTKLQEKISKMSLLDMRVYVNGRLDEFEVDEYGLHEIVKKLMSINEETSKHFIEMDDMDSKKKKAFDLLVLILENKKVSISVVEAVQEFLEIYSEIIAKFDKENKQIYENRIKKKISQAINKINAESDIINVMEVSK